MHATMLRSFEMKTKEVCLWRLDVLQGSEDYCVFPSMSCLHRVRHFLNVFRAENGDRSETLEPQICESIAMTTLTDNCMLHRGRIYL